MNPQLFKFFRDLWADLRDPDVVWQLGTNDANFGVSAETLVNSTMPPT